MARVIYDYKQMQVELVQIADKLRQFDFEMIIPVTRGGLVPAAYLGYLLDIKNFDTLCLNCYEYDRQHQMSVIKVPDIRHIKKHKILVVDSIVDNGTTLEKTRELLGNEVKFFTIHYKPHSMAKPDFYIHETKDWIVYPWECEK